MDEIFSPFASVELDLRPGNAIGRIPYEERKKRFVKRGLQGHINCRDIAREDYSVVKKLHAESQDQRLIHITEEGNAHRAVWRHTLLAYLDANTLLIHPMEVNFP